MALHPDDPPYPIFGLPRVITCEENLDRYLSIVDSPSNALCLCTGSLGCAKFNDVPALVRKYSAAGRIGFMHLRNVKIPVSYTHLVVHRARTLLEEIKARAVPWGLCRTLLALSQMAGALAVSSSSSMPKKRSSSRWDQG